MIESVGAIRRCEIYSLTGQLIISFADASERLEVPVEELPYGTYLVKLVTDHTAQTLKFVKE